MHIHFVVTDYEVVAKIEGTYRKFIGRLPYNFNQHGLTKLQNSKDILTHKILASEFTTDLHGNSLGLGFVIPNGARMYNYNLALHETFDISDDTINNINEPLSQELFGAMKNRIIFLEKKVEDMEDRISKLERNNCKEYY